MYLAYRQRRNQNSVQDWENSIRQFFNLSWPRTQDLDDGSDSHWSPVIDVSETKTEIIIEAEIPGLGKDDINVSVDNNTLTIKGEKKQETKTDEEDAVRTERVYGRFVRELSLPQSVDAEKIKATYKNGVLHVTLPKQETAQPKQISIDVD